MKRNYLLAALCLLWTINAHALIVSVDGQGEIGEEGMEITINDAEEDPMTGKNLMELEGNLLCSGPLTVTISRSAAGIEDEFCCGTNCTAGNGEATDITLWAGFVGIAQAPETFALRPEIGWFITRDTNE